MEGRPIIITIGHNGRRLDLKPILLDSNSVTTELFQGVVSSKYKYNFSTVMGACVTTSKPRYPELRQVQMKDGSTIQPAPISALRYVNTPNQAQPFSATEREKTQSLIRANSSGRPISPALPTTYLGRPTSPLPEVRADVPLVQSVISISEVYGPNAQTIQPVVIHNQQAGISSGIRPVEVAQVHPPTPRSNSNRPPQLLFIGSTNELMEQHSRTTTETMQRTSANIPFPAPPQPIQTHQPFPIGTPIQQPRPSRTVVQLDSRSQSPGHTAITSVNQVAKQAGSASNTPIINVQSNQLSTPFNAPPAFSNTKNPLTTIRQMPSLQNQQIAVPTLVTNPPKTTIPDARLMAPLQPNLNFDRRLLNFDKSMFTGDSKTPKLNSFTYNLNLSIAGSSKARVL